MNFERLSASFKHSGGLLQKGGSPRSRAWTTLFKVKKSLKQSQVILWHDIQASEWGCDGMELHYKNAMYRTVLFITKFEVKKCVLNANLALRLGRNHGNVRFLTTQMLANGCSQSHPINPGDHGIISLCSLVNVFFLFHLKRLFFLCV